MGGGTGTESAAKRKCDEVRVHTILPKGELPNSKLPTGELPNSKLPNGLVMLLRQCLPGNAGLAMWTMPRMLALLARQC